MEETIPSVTAKESPLYRATSELRRNPIGTVGALVSLVAVGFQIWSGAIASHEVPGARLPSVLSWFIVSYPMAFIAAFISRVVFVADNYAGWSISLVLSVTVATAVYKLLEPNLQLHAGAMAAGFAIYLCMGLVVITLFGVAGSAVNEVYEVLKRQKTEGKSGRTLTKATRAHAEAFGGAAFAWCLLFFLGAGGLMLFVK